MVREYAAQIRIADLSPEYVEVVVRKSHTPNWEVGVRIRPESFRWKTLSAKSKRMAQRQYKRAAEQLLQERADAMRDESDRLIYQAAELERMKVEIEF